MATEQSTPVVYKDITGLTGFRVGNDGSVWSCRRTVPLKGQKRGFASAITQDWKQRVPYVTRSGHLIICLVKSYPMRPIHQLVLEAFVGPRPDGTQCCHNDGNPANNRVENLRWDTIKANAADRRKHGNETWGESNGMTKLTEAIVLSIRAEYATGNISQKLIAAKYGVNKNTVQKIISRFTWKHV